VEVNVNHNDSRTQVNLVRIANSPEVLKKECKKSTAFDHIIGEYERRKRKDRFMKLRRGCEICCMVLVFNSEISYVSQLYHGYSGFHDHIVD
jgi:hypothetical protein